MPAYRTVEVHTKSTDFRTATRIVEVAELPAATPGNVVVKNHYVGINATDVNITNGAYGARPLPFSCGLEGVGEVVAVGDGVENFKVGEAIAYQKIGAFSEYVVVPAATALKVPSTDPSVLPLLVQGISGSIALEQVGQMKSGETVLVTAAAGGTGQFVVQLAKLAGNHVIGTCSSDDKVEYLRSIGCDRPVNYRKENLADVLKKEYPRGVDIVFESVGGEMYETAVNALARHGRLIVIGAIAGYEDASAWKGNSKPVRPLSTKLLAKSASVRGFFLNDFYKHTQGHTKKLTTLVQRGTLNAGVDPTKFYGLEDVAAAIDHMYQRKNIGKIVVDMTKSASAARL